MRVDEYGASVGLLGVAGNKELAGNLKNDIQGHIRSDTNNQAPTSLNRRIQEPGGLVLGAV